MGDKNYYIYCIALAPDGTYKCGTPGHHGEKPFAVIYKDIAAYAEKTPLTYFDATLENLECHERVIAEIMARFNVLPMSFSTIFKSEDAVIAAMEKYYDQFKENLRAVDGKIELGVKMFYRLDYEKEDKRDKTERVSPKEYMMRRYERYQKRREQTDAILSKADELHEILSGLSSDSRSAKPLKNNMIFNASYLVPVLKKDEFDKAVEEAKIRYPSYKIIYSGPWPAYHFIKIVREGEEDERS